MITVRVPATSANMGPGFDTLGIALKLYARVSMERAERGFLITGADEQYCNEDNLVYIAYRAALARLGVGGDGVRIHIESDIPISRGLGSSAAMYVAGIMGAAALHGRELDKEVLLEITNTLEKHPDNFAAAIYGGFTSALVYDGRPYAVRCPVADGLKLCAFIPEFMTNTEKARAALPKTVLHEDAAYTVAHALALINGLGSGNDETIRRAVSDKLHEPYRKKLIPGFDALKAAAEDVGCVAFYISGSGSTCMSIYRDPAFPEKAQRAVAPLAGKWRVLPLEIDSEGAALVS
ncbi:MAG TPA: homoserine kinase [Clostridia bacterium]|nr:homoserine kinase [Clostridia bacterium]